MNVLNVVSSMHPKNGGISNLIKNYITIWDDNAHIVKTNVVTVDNPNEVYDNSDRYILLGDALSSRWGYSKKLELWLLDNVANYDVIIVHGLWQYTNYCVGKVISNLKKQGKQTPKVFIMPHGMLDPYFQKASSRLIKAIRNIIYWAVIEKHTINKSDGLLFTCEEEMRLASLTFKGYKPKNTFNVGLGIIPPPKYIKTNQQSFYKKFPTLDGEKFILFLGRIDEKKGIDMLIDAYERIFEIYWSESKLLQKLMIVGPGFDTPYGKVLKKRIESNQFLNEKIVIANMLSGDDKWAAFYESDVFILPSHQENFGIAVAEAMACNKAVLISNKVNIWTEIEQSNSGIVEDDTLVGTVDLLLKWAHLSKEEKIEKCDNAYSVFQNKFNANCTALQLIDILKKNSTPILKKDFFFIKKPEITNQNLQVQNTLKDTTRIFYNN